MMWVCLVKSLLQGYSANSLVGGQKVAAGCPSRDPNGGNALDSVVRRPHQDPDGTTRGMDALSDIGLHPDGNSNRLSSLAVRPVALLDQTGRRVFIRYFCPPVPRQDPKGR